MRRIGRLALVLMFPALAALAACSDAPVSPRASANTVLFWAYAGRVSDVYAVDADGGTPRRLTNTGTAAEPAWSANGRWIVYLDRGLPNVRGEPSLQVFVMRADGSGSRQVTGDTGRVESPTISPDGRQVAYECGGRTVPGPFQICVAAVAGGASLRVTPPTFESSSPVWSPDGAWIAVACAPSGATVARLCTVRPDGTELETTSLDSLTVGSVAWAPDAARFAVSAAVVDSIFYTLYIVSRDGRQVRRVFNETTPTAYRSAPSWSPDGARLAFVRYGLGAKIYVASVDGSGERPLVTDAREQQNPSWSPIPP